jgi:hypothetical protein
MSLISDQKSVRRLPGVGFGAETPEERFTTALPVPYPNLDP